MADNSYMTRDEFLRNEIFIWDEEYVTSLLDAGYEPLLTTAGWKWILPERIVVTEEVSGRTNSALGI